MASYNLGFAVANLYLAGATAGYLGVGTRSGPAVLSENGNRVWLEVNDTSLAMGARGVGPGLQWSEQGTQYWETIAFVQDVGSYAPANDWIGWWYDGPGWPLNPVGQLNGYGVLQVAGRFQGYAGASLQLTVLNAPSSLTATVGTSGTVGSYLAANTTYDYAVTAVAPDNTETTISNTEAASEGATPYPITLAWTSPGNTREFNIYKAVSGSALGLLTSVSGGTTSYTDTGNTATGSQAPPVNNLTGFATFQSVLINDNNFSWPALQIGASGSGAQNFALGLPNALSTTNRTQIGTLGSGTTVAGIEATILGVAYEDNWWGVALDGNANVGVRGNLAFGGSATVGVGNVPFILAENGIVASANRGLGALAQYYDGVGIQGYTNSGADANPIFGVLTNDEAVEFEVYNGGKVITAHNTLDDGAGNAAVGGALAAASTIQAGSLATPYAELGLNIVGTNASQMMTWWDNSQEYGAGLVENNNQVGLLLVNKGSSAYNGLNASSYTVPLFANTSGAVMTQALMNTAIGTNASWAARNTLDDGSGNLIAAGNVTVDGGTLQIGSSSGDYTTINYAGQVGGNVGNWHVPNLITAAQGQFTPGGGSGTDIAADSAIWINGNYGGATQAQSNPNGMMGWNLSNGGGEVDIISSTAGGGGGLSVYKLTGSSAPYTPQLLAEISTAGVTLTGTEVYHTSAGPLVLGIAASTSTNELAWSYGVTFPSGTGIFNAGAIRQSTAGTMYLFGMDSPSTSGIDLYASNTGMFMWGNLVTVPG